MKKIIIIFIIGFISNGLIAQAVTKNGESTNTSINFVDKNGKIGNGILNKNGKVLTAPSLTTTSPNNISQTSASSGGNINSDGGSAIIARGVCWNTSQNPSITTNHTSDSSGTGSFISIMNGLEMSTTYYVRAYATNSVGTAYSSQYSFTTVSICGQNLVDSRDGYIYSVVHIGNQCWMSENLKYLPSVSSAYTTSSTTPLYYVYGYSGTSVNAAKLVSNYSTYGVLYNWPAAMAGSASSSNNPSEVQGVCPTGWHLPSLNEWRQLTNYLVDSTIVGGKLKETGTNHWSNPNIGATNEVGFNAIPGGELVPITNEFRYIGSYSFWWTTTEISQEQYYINISNSSSSIQYDHALQNKTKGYSVRCVKD